MHLRSLKTEADYKEALAEIDQLIEASPETAEEDRLDILVLLVETY